MAGRTIGFAVIGADHPHIYTMVAGMIEAGAVMKGWWTEDAPTYIQAARLVEAGGPFKQFHDQKRDAANAEAALGGTYADPRKTDPFPGVRRVGDRRELLDDPSIDVILLAPLHTQRAALAIEAMQHGKDVMCDKPGAISLAEMHALRQAVAETGRIWSVDWSERYHVPAVVKASELVGQGVIGKVVQTVNLASHRPQPQRRPSWWFDTRQHGGVMCYLASHSIDQFLHFTGSTTAAVASSTVGNFRFPQWNIEDFGDLVLHGNNGVGYIRVDWYTPDQQTHPGDNRLFVIGTEGQIEVRKYVDLAGRPGANHLFLETGGKAEYIDCSGVKLTYFDAFLNDIRDRTETAETQSHSFLANELAVQAQLQASRLGHLAGTPAEAP